jgi:hypothetical protein
MLRQLKKRPVVMRAVIEHPPQYSIYVERFDSHVVGREMWPSFHHWVTVVLSGFIECLDQWSPWVVPRCGPTLPDTW